EMTVVGELILLFARDVPLLCHELGALPHRQPGARLDDRGQHRLEGLRAQAEPWRDALPGGAPAIAGEQQLLVRAWVDDRRIADRVGAAGNAGLDLTERDLVADVDGRLETRTAGALHVETGRVRIESAGEHAFAHQIVVARV